jgi:tellurite resistance protein TerA
MVEVIKIEESSTKTMCGIETLENSNGNLKILKLEKYYGLHRELDKDFGFGFKWSSGSK